MSTKFYVQRASLAGIDKLQYWTGDYWSNLIDMALFFDDYKDAFAKSMVLDLQYAAVSVGKIQLRD